MNYYQHLSLSTLSFYLLCLSFKIINATDSEPMTMSSNNMEEACKKPVSKSFEEEWPLLQTAVDRLINQIEEKKEGVVASNSSTFTTDQYISYYTTVYELCTTTKLGDTNSMLLYLQYKTVFQDYINSAVLPSLREKKDEFLLRELLRRWSNHKIMTRWLSRFFYYLERYYIPRWELPSLEETSFLSFYDLVYDEMTKEVMSAILSMIDQERAGEQIDRTLVNNILTVYSEIENSTRKINAKAKTIKENVASSNRIPSLSLMKEEKLDDIPSTNSSKNMKLISSDGDAFEVDYDVVLMSKTIEDAIKSNPVGDDDDDINSISLPVVNSKMLVKVIEYCKKHTQKNMSDVGLVKWDAEFVDVHYETLIDLALSANYLNIKSLHDLTISKLGDMIKGKTPREIRQIFNIKDM